MRIIQNKKNSASAPKFPRLEILTGRHSSYERITVEDGPQNEEPQKKYEVLDFSVKLCHKDKDKYKDKGKGHWHLLACSPLFYASEDVLDIPKNFFDKLDIDLDDTDEDGNSFLYYALRKSTLNKHLTRFGDVFNRLMEANKTKSPKYVYCNHKKSLVQEFFISEYEGQFKGVKPDFTYCSVPEKSEMAFSEQ